MHLILSWFSALMSPQNPPAEHFKHKDACWSHSKCAAKNILYLSFGAHIYLTL